MANVKYICTTSDKLSEIAVEVGNLIFCEDTRQIALDGENGRVFYDQIMCLATDDMRGIMLPNLVPGFYFIFETNILWRLTTSYEWIQITSNPDSQLVYGTLDTFPRPGRTGVIYFSSDNLYHWDPDSYSYEDYSKNTIEWRTN